MMLSSKGIYGLLGLVHQTHGAPAQCAGVWGRSPLEKYHIRMCANKIPLL